MEQLERREEVRAVSGEWVDGEDGRERDEVKWAGERRSLLEKSGQTFTCSSADDVVPAVKTAGR
jgi:hypothetical protein